MLVQVDGAVGNLCRSVTNFPDRRVRIGVFLRKTPDSARVLSVKRFGMEEKMKITKNFTDGVLTMQIDGRIDTMTAPELEGELKHSVTDDVKVLIFDFAKVEYLTSAGIRVIMAAEKVMSTQGQMKLIHVNDEINEIFDMTGLIDLLTIE